MIASLFPRRLAHRITLPFRGLSIGVRGVVRDRHGGILLVRHTYVPGWHLPGGGVRPGETAVEAARREIVEETGILPADDLQLFGIYLNRRLHSRDHVLLFRCGAWERKNDFAPGLEIADAHFFTLDRLPQDLSSGTARMEELFDGIPVRTEW